VKHGGEGVIGNREVPRIEILRLRATEPEAEEAV
jgi:hypothetical protein